VFARVAPELGCAPEMQHRVFVWLARSAAWPMGCRIPSLSWLCRNAQIERSWRARPRAAQRDATNRARSPPPSSPPVARRGPRRWRRSSPRSSGGAEEEQSRGRGGAAPEQRRGGPYVDGAEAGRPYPAWEPAAGADLPRPAATPRRRPAMTSRWGPVGTGGDLMGGVNDGM
jgi:hypothetical protein